MAASARRAGRVRAAGVLVALAAALLLAACAGGGGTGGGGTPSASRGGGGTAADPATADGTKVMVIVEEAKPASYVLGTNRAPFLDQLARSFGSATRMTSGVRPACPSLPAYLLMTSGDTHGVCDNQAPRSHQITGSSIFTQVEAMGREWRAYAESMPAPCTRKDGPKSRFVVRHAPATYYVSLRERCQQWQVPLGTPAAGALHDDVVAGSLPAFAFVTPDLCNDMRGGGTLCPGSLVRDADTWLATWLPLVMDAPDYRSGRLVLVITWDQPVGKDQRIATLVIAPGAQGKRVTQPLTHCGMLRMEEELLGLAPLGCARGATSPRAAFGLAATTG